MKQKSLLTPKKQNFSKNFLSRWPPQWRKHRRKFTRGSQIVVNVAQGTARGNIEQDSLSDSCYTLNKRMALEELRRAIKEIDRNKGFDPYNWHTCLKSLMFFTLCLFLHLVNTCFEVGFWPSKQVSVILLKKPGKAASSVFAYRCISSIIACKQIAGAHTGC